MIKLIVATDQDLLIGKKDSVNGMPWHLPEDLKFFKETTINQTIVMGKTTYQAIGRPLPNRQTIVVTKSDFKDERVIIKNDLIETIQSYQNAKQDLYICGGASIYKQSLPFCDELIISRVPGKHQGETHFPNFSHLNFKLVEEIPFETFTVERYRKEG